MMNQKIKSVAVLGAGIMGARIGCHFANIGVKVLLLDLPFSSPVTDEKTGEVNLNTPVDKNKLVKTSLEEAILSEPAPLFKKSFVSRIKTGNFEDNLKDIGNYDWIIEAITENSEIKRDLLKKIDKYRAKGSMVTTNTSGIPIHLLSEGLSEDMQRNFCGTHFFNPPRYLQLLEVISTQKTDPQLINFLLHYGDLFLGKTTIQCKDTPGFIGNRIGIFAMLKTIDTMLRMDLTIDEVDRLTGSVAGRPKSATFRTSDIVGLDTLIKVANNLFSSLEKDDNRNIFKLPDLVYELEKRNWLGDKTKQGFYKKIKNKKGETEILTLDLRDLEYKPKKKAKFGTLDAAKNIDDLKERIKILFQGKDKAGEFYRDTLMGLFQYASLRISEITDDIYKIDEALCAGFGWELGPFETWEILGIKPVFDSMNSSGYQPAPWVEDFIKSGYSAFYTVESGIKKCYNPSAGLYQAIPGKEGIIILDAVRQNRTIWQNSGASIIDIGDGIINIEFHFKMNTMGSEVVEGINKGIDLAEKDFRGVVIGNEGQNFSAGANLAILFMLAIEQDYQQIDFVIRHFQNTIMRVRYSSIPVVVAPHDLTLGGSCEMSMHADCVQAAAETYIGLVEVGVGLIPGGCGTKEMTARASEIYEAGDIEYNRLQNIFTNIAMGKVATSASEARDMKFLRPTDKITMNKKRLIHDAKKTAIGLYESGYNIPDPDKKIKVQGRGGMALFYAGIHQMKQAGYISDHDVKIAQKIANIMCGGDLSSSTEVSERYLLDLEREAFLSLCGERKTLERIEAILQGRKPLRN